MASNSKFSMRIIHRYLGFFLAGIMAVYALSGMVLIFRDTDFLKKEVQMEKQIKPQASKEELGQLLDLRRLEVEKEENGFYIFKDGRYNIQTGVAQYTLKELPYILDKMTHLHCS